MAKDHLAAPGRSPKRLSLRALLAGPIVFVGSYVLMAGSALWLPQGAAGVNHIALPVLLMPAIWAALFFYAYLDKKLLRAYGVIGALLGIHILLIWQHLNLGT